MHTFRDLSPSLVLLHFITFLNRREHWGYHLRTKCNTPSSSMNGLLSYWEPPLLTLGSGNPSNPSL